MSEYQKKAKKHLGQHFLSDQTYVAAIIQAVSPDKDDCFFEIGPGPGVLTDELIDHVTGLTAVELDLDCVAFLREKYVDRPHFHLVAADILEFSFSSLLKAGPLRVIGNLPYNISSPILFRLHTLAPIMVDAHFMLQQEFAMRCYAKPGTPNYGRLTVMLALIFDVYPVLVVPDSAFSPPPKVQSEVIRLIPKQNVWQGDTALFSAIVQHAFSQRRKMLRKIFQKYLTQDDWNHLDIDGSLRPEALSLQDYTQLASYQGGNLKALLRTGIESPPY